MVFNDCLHYLYGSLYSAVYGSPQLYAWCSMTVGTTYVVVCTVQYMVVRNYMHEGQFLWCSVTICTTYIVVYTVEKGLTPAGFRKAFREAF